jgi:hypothetical protein
LDWGGLKEEKRRKEKKRSIVTPLETTLIGFGKREDDSWFYCLPMVQGHVSGACHM